MSDKASGGPQSSDQDRLTDDERAYLQALPKRASASLTEFLKVLRESNSVTTAVAFWRPILQLTQILPMERSAEFARAIRKLIEEDNEGQISIVVQNGRIKHIEVTLRILVDGLDAPAIGGSTPASPLPPNIMTVTPEEGDLLKWLFPRYDLDDLNCLISDAHDAAAIRSAFSDDQIRRLGECINAIVSDGASGRISLIFETGHVRWIEVSRRDVFMVERPRYTPGQRSFSPEED